MKRLFNHTILAMLAMFVATTSCSDDLSNIGSSVCPSTDGIIIKTDNFDVPIQTVCRDAIYVRTGYPLLGKVTDPYMGEYKAVYLAQFYASKETTMDVVSSSDSTLFGLLRTSVVSEHDAKYPDDKWDPKGYYTSRYDSLVGNQIDSMTIRIYYQSYYGDSLSPMKVNIYALDSTANFEELPESAFYSNYQFESLYSKKNFLGSKGYTPANREVSDSLRNTSDYMNYIEVKLDDKYKDQFLEMAVKAAIVRDKKSYAESLGYADIFSNQEELRKEWLSGVYVTPTFGDGSLIKVYYTAIYLFYSSFHRYAEDGTLLRNAADDGDSTYVSNHVKYVAVTPDVIQMTGFERKAEDKLDQNRVDSNDTAYVSSPLGYYSTIDLPVGKIVGKMMKMADSLDIDSCFFLNAANFYLKAYKPYGSVLSNTPVPTLLMVQQDSADIYFEEGQLPSSSTSCYATYACDSVPNDNYNDPTSGVYYYKFGNINSVILGLAKNSGWNKNIADTTEWKRTLITNGKLKANQTINDYSVKMALLPVEVSTNSTYGTLLSVANYIQPTCLRLHKGDAKQSIQMIYSLEGGSGK